MGINSWITSGGVVVSLIFAVLVLRQYSQRKKMHQLMWGIALVLWALGVSAELVATLNNGWADWDYRLYYTTGALLIPAWLGMGTLFLVFHQRWVNWVLTVLAIVSVIGIALIAVWPIDPAALKATQEHFLPLKVFPFFPVQIVLIILNSFGTVAFVGGALWSVYKFAQMHSEGERVLATALIAFGGFIAAGAHSLGVIADIELFRISELLAVIFIFVGFLLTTPMTKKATTPVKSSSQ